MLRTLCKSKIKQAFITDKVLHYNGSIGIDRSILESVDILPGEQVQVLNVNNAERFITYVIEEKADSGNIVLYGPAARKGEIGDELIILSFGIMDTKEALNFKMRQISLAKNNKCKN